VTSYRHASAQRMLLKESSLDDVVMKMNTNKEMIQRVYAHSSNEHFALQKHIERYKGYYTREEKKKT
jgi:hypothetical protein